jgi:MFS transporter, ACS family, D-galactonate transporter
MSRASAHGASPSFADEVAPTWPRWQIVGLLMAYSFMTWFNRVSMSVAYDEKIKDEAGISPEDIGIVYSAFLFSYMVCMTPGGWLIDRFGPWVALVVMGVGSALFGALTGTAGLPALVTAGLLWPALFVIRSFMGMLTAPVYPACSRVVAHWVPRTQRARANGVVQGAAAVGIACAFPVFGWLIDWVDWQKAFLISGAVTMLLALGWTAFGSNHPAQHRAAEIAAGNAAPARASWWTLLANPSLMLLTLSYAAVGYIEYLFFFWMHYYFEKILKFDESDSRIYAMILTLSMAVGMILGGWIADRLRTAFGGGRSIGLVPALGMCAGGVLLVLGVLAEETVWIVTLLALAMAAVGATEAPVWTMAVELGKRNGGTAAAICNTGGNAGGMIAPYITPFVSGWIARQYGVSELVGWQWGIGLSSVIAIWGAVLWFWITPNDSGHQHVPEEISAENG